MAGRLEGKVCIITGTSSGMGAETARVFADEGAIVVGAARRLDKGQAVIDEITAKGHEALFVQTDVSKLEDLDNLVNTTLEKYGRIDVLISNAGTGGFFDIHEMDLEKDFYFMFNMFARANWYLAKLVLPTMMKQNKGDILFTLSTAAINGVAQGSAYSGSKAAVRNLSKAICQAYGKYNIRSSCLLPGLITTELSDEGGLMERMQTPYIPMGRPGTCHEVAMAYVFMASDECRFMSGADIVVDGGNDVGIMYPVPQDEDLLDL